MSQQGSGGVGPNRKLIWIAALLALLVVGLGVWLMSRGGRDDNLVPEAVAVDPSTGAMTATGTAALDATGTDTGGPATPGVYNEDSTGGTQARTEAEAMATGTLGADPAAGATTGAAAGTAAPATGTPPQQ